VNHSDEPFFLAVEQRLKDIGKAVGAIERDSGLGQDTIRNILRAKSETGPQLATARDVARALGWEFYFGPPREVTPRGFAEEAAFVFGQKGAPKEVTEVFKKGYLPFPWHDLARQTTPPPFVISLAWLEAQNIDPAHLRFAELPNQAEGPTFALLDTSTAHSVGAATWCWLEEGTLRLEWAMRDQDGPLIIFSGGDTNRPIKVHPDQLAQFRFLGRAVWTARLEPAKTD
jgi:DNA-binding phage protein